MLSGLLIAALWLPAGNVSLVCDVFLCFCHFHMWRPGSGVVLDCIDSCSLPSYLLFFAFSWNDHWIFIMLLDFYCLA